MISILISTYGSEQWERLAQERALASALRQTAAHEVLTHHEPAGTVSSCRNANAERATGEWLCFLDADDELDTFFCQAMLREMTRTSRNGRVLFTPAVSYVKNGRLQPPRFWPEIPLESANWLILGTLIERDFFFEVGGFIDYGDPPGSNAYEDWALWARCAKAGASVVKVRRAVYIAHHSPQSRHHGADHQTRLGWHHEIGADLFPDRYPPEWPHAHQRRPGRRQRTRRER